MFNVFVIVVKQIFLWFIFRSIKVYVFSHDKAWFSNVRGTCRGASKNVIFSLNIIGVDFSILGATSFTWMRFRDLLSKTWNTINLFRVVFVFTLQVSGKANIAIVDIWNEASFTYVATFVRAKATALKRSCFFQKHAECQSSNKSSRSISWESSQVELQQRTPVWRSSKSLQTQRYWIVDLCSVDLPNLYFSWLRSFAVSCFSQRLSPQKLGFDFHEVPFFWFLLETEVAIRNLRQSCQLVLNHSSSNAGVFMSLMSTLPVFCLNKNKVLFLDIWNVTVASRWPYSFLFNSN